jgi:hypothetical protein
MAIYLRARRELLFDRFLEQWLDLQRQGFRARLEFAVAERVATAEPAAPEQPAEPAAPTAPSPDGNGHVELEALPSNQP